MSRNSKAEQELKPHLFALNTDELQHDLPTATDVTRRSAVDAVSRLTASLLGRLEDKATELGLGKEVDFSQANVMGPLGLVSIDCTDAAAQKLYKSGVALSFARQKEKSLSRQRSKAHAFA